MSSRVAVTRAGWWTLRAHRQARREVARRGLEADVSQPPALPVEAGHVVDSVLRRLGASCLERAVVRQQWDLAHGRMRALIVGVTAVRPRFRAHAWLEGDQPCHSEEFAELIRRMP
jgi:hypothetical protein